MLTCYNTPQLKKIVYAVKAGVPAEKIFLLAVQTACFGYSSVFNTQQSPAPEPVHYYLLVLPESSQYRSNETWQDMIEHRCRAITPVTAWVLPVAKFVQWLEAGQPFACTVYHDALLSYDAGKVVLPVPPPGNKEETEHALRRECVHYTNRSAGFLNGSEQYYLRRQYKLAAFLLHQAAEQAYIAINWRATGFRPMVHSLEKLHRYALPFSEKVADVFPQNSERELHLFRLLQKAYIDSRYTSEYEVQEDELLCLTGRVGRLQEIAAACCGA